MWAKTASAPVARRFWVSKMKHKTQALLCYSQALLLVLVDQLVKLWVRDNLAVGQRQDFLPFVELLHVENTGAAFSSFDRFTWVLTLLSAVVSVILALGLWKKWFSTGWFSELAVTLILGGAVGNLIDRAFFHKVTDMFNFTFMTFGVFNVADICVCVGVGMYVVYLLFGPKEEKKEQNHEDNA